ncbi:hypothetical protein HNV11_23720 (plasmid) [Spirosoma taeanense]|uniref:Uncharacterized protein n=1 Tax=Spirosoma taeanense TaxID=2735870 RepID=A0A6M5YGV6_9BACT|nr:hypothetical protein [Spirosoma taeanense]QJW92483.1 hypothetical protein HNV11_23720 [Spirosoma taeanense]
MTPEEKKAALFGKLKEEPKPVTTKVVPVEAKPAKATKAAAEETEHFNVYLPVSLAKKIRLKKVELGKGATIQGIIIEALEQYFQ